MPRAKKLFDEKKLTPAQTRKLRAARKGMIKLLGEQVGKQEADKAFAVWLKSNPQTNGGADAELIADTLWQLVRSKKLQISRGGFSVKRGRGRIIVKSLGS